MDLNEEINYIQGMQDKYNSRSLSSPSIPLDTFYLSIKDETSIIVGSYTQLCRWLHPKDLESIDMFS